MSTASAPASGTSAASCDIGSARRPLTLIQMLNGPWHKVALWSFTAIVLAHWAEHLAQATQIYILKWPVPASRGVLGLWFPWLISSELLHYAYALVMLIALWILRSGFVGRSYVWWMIALGIQFWHHIEHALLQGQALLQSNLFGSPVPVSMAQLLIPRVELHLFYNTIVFVPMVVAMFYHMYPTPEEESRMHCTCSWHPRPARS